MTAAYYVGDAPQLAIACGVLDTKGRRCKVYRGHEIDHIFQGAPRRRLSCRICSEPLTEHRISEPCR